MTLELDFPCIWQLLHDVYHEDFELVYESAEEAFDDFLAWNPSQGSRAKIVEEVNGLLAMSDDRIEQVLGELSSSYQVVAAYGDEIRRWLERLRERAQSR